MIFRIKITKIEFSVVKLKFPDQKWKIHFLISKMGNTLGVRKKRDPKDGPKPRNHVLLPTKSVTKQKFLASFSCLKNCTPCWYGQRSSFLTDMSFCTIPECLRGVLSRACGDALYEYVPGVLGLPTFGQTYSAKPRSPPKGQVIPSMLIR